MERQKKQKTQAPSSLALAFDRCASELFSFLADHESANVARALCVSQFLSDKCYDIKRELPFRSVLAGFYSGVVHRVSFDGQYDDPSLLDLLPSSVTSLNVTDHASLRWSVRDLPHSLVHFAYRSVYASPTLFRRGVPGPDEWPSSLTSLAVDFFAPTIPLPSTLRVLDYKRNLPSRIKLPESLTTLRTRYLGRPYNQLPPLITTLEFHVPECHDPDSEFVDVVGLPASLTHLTIHGEGEYEDRTIELPSTLRHLRLDTAPIRLNHELAPQLETLNMESTSTMVFFGKPERSESSFFDTPVCHTTLQTLILPDDFSQTLYADELPNLKVLSVGPYFDRSLAHLPSLSELTIRESYEAYLYPLGHLPASLTILNVYRMCEFPLKDLPRSLRVLRIGSYHDHSLGGLPDSLTELCLRSSKYELPLGRLPEQLQVLRLGPEFDHPLDALPSGLTHLDLESAEGFDTPLTRLPESLQVLSLPRDFNHPLDHLPPRLQVLTFAERSQFNHPLELPETLCKLVLSDEFNRPFSRLPGSLTHFVAGRSFNHPLPLVRPGPSASLSSNSGLPMSASSSSSAAPGHANGALNSSVAYPADLRTLHLGQAFLNLPPSLTKLSFAPSAAFSQPLPIASLPETLLYLQVPDIYRSRFLTVQRDALRRRCPFVGLPPIDPKAKGK